MCYPQRMLYLFLWKSNYDDDYRSNTKVITAAEKTPEMKLEAISNLPRKQIYSMSLKLSNSNVCEYATGLNARTSLKAITN